MTVHFLAFKIMREFCSCLALEVYINLCIVYIYTNSIFQLLNIEGLILKENIWNSKLKVLLPIYNIYIS